MKKASLSVLTVGLLLASSLSYSEEVANKTQETAPATPAAVQAVATEQPAAAVAVPSTEAQQNTAVVAAPTEAPAAAPVTAAADPVAAPASPAVPVAEATTPAVAKEAEVSENVEFVSGEVSSIDAAAKTVTVKLYGEADDKAGDKVITVKVDESTDITDGDKDRDLASLSAGTEVDVEYDPASNKATYIFVY